VRKDTVGDRVASALRKSGLDDAEVAEAANVTAAWLSAVKNDRIKSPPLDKLLAVARVCRVPGRYLTEPLGVVPLGEVGADAIVNGLAERDKELVEGIAARLREAPPDEHAAAEGSGPTRAARS
jgi:transcriptional regulator with XRE-family HTH domain